MADFYGSTLGTNGLSKYKLPEGQQLLNISLLDLQGWRLPHHSDAKHKS